MAFRSLVRSKVLSGFLLLWMAGLGGQAAAEEITYRVKLKDREFHIVGSRPFWMPDDPVNQNLMKLVDAASAVALENDFLIASRAAANLNIVSKAAADMPAKAMPDALKAKFSKALAATGDKGLSPDFYLAGHLVDAALAIRQASAPFPAGSATLTADNLVMARGFMKKKTVLPLLDTRQYYDFFSKLPRAAIEEYISLGADAILDPTRGAAWKDAYNRCYEAQRSQLPTPAYDACTRDLHQKLKIPAAWLRGYYDERNALLVDSMIAIVEKQDSLLVSLNVVHLGGQGGVLNLLRQRGATWSRVSGGPEKQAPAKQ